jgi:hypothetical protein
MERCLITAEGMKEFSMIQFRVEDIIRSDFVKAWIQAAEKSSVVFPT